MVTIFKHLIVILRRKKRFVVVGITCLLLVLYFYRNENGSTTKLRNEPISRVLHNCFETEDSTIKTKTFLLIVIMTGPNNFNKRKVLRDTWLSQNKNESETMHFFVIGSKGLNYGLGQQLREEQQQYNDLILLNDFEDAYEKLTEKLGITLSYLQKHFSFRYLFKADDDTFAMVNQLIYELKHNKTINTIQNLYWGYFYGRGHVKTSGPWKETEWKLCDYYLPHARGGGYILSKNLVEFVAYTFPILKQYKSEDISLGAWLAPLELTRIHDIRFNTEYKSRGCKDLYIVTHKQSVEDIQKLHSNLQKYNKLCIKESTLMYGYDYNWDVPPSQCCKRTKGIP